MDKPYLCPDCGDQHDEPGEALLGFRARCLDCQIEADLAAEFAAVPAPRVAA
jgi:hypothetical protein